MIRSFRSEDLRSLYEGNGNPGSLQNRAERLRAILSVLDQATCPEELRINGLELAPVPTKGVNYYAVAISGNWRVLTFCFEEGSVHELDYADYMNHISSS